MTKIILKFIIPVVCVQCSTQNVLVYLFTMSFKWSPIGERILIPLSDRWVCSRTASVKPNVKYLTRSLSRKERWDEKSLDLKNAVFRMARIYPPNKVLLSANKSWLSTNYGQNQRKIIKTHIKFTNSNETRD